MVVKWTFISCYFLGAHRTYFWLQVTSEAINFEPIKIQTCYAPQNDRLNLSFVKDEHTNGKKWPEMVVTRSFIKDIRFQSLFMWVLGIGVLHNKRPKNIATSSFFGNFMRKKHRCNMLASTAVSKAVRALIVNSWLSLASKKNLCKLARNQKFILRDRTALQCLLI